LASTPDFFILDNAGLHKLMRIQKWNIIIFIPLLKTWHLN
jgi:hypothetical protein